MMNKPSVENLSPKFEPSSEGRHKFLILGDINNFSNIMRGNSNAVVSEFLRVFHQSIQEYCNKNNLSIKHESGDSFWIMAEPDNNIEEISDALLGLYTNLMANNPAIVSIEKSGLRMAYTKAEILSYTVDGEVHYNSREHAALRLAIEDMPRIHGVMPLSALWNTSPAPLIQP